MSTQAIETRISFIIGAGASLDFCSEISTNKLTDSVLKCDICPDILLPYKDKITSLISEVYKELKKKYETPNFEHIFQYLLDIQVNYSKEVSRLPKFELPEFSALKDGNKELLINASKFYLLNCIYQNIRQNRIMFYNGDPYSWRTRIFDVAKEFGLLDIFTLNYDEYLDTVIDSYNDGFIKSGEEHCIGEYKVFDESCSHDYLGENLLNHLHGSIEFSRIQPPEEPNVKILTKYAAPLTELSITNYELQDHSIAALSPIITGLDKLNFVMHVPFRCYHSNFDRSLSSNDRLIIIGYGFGDYYVNATIDTFLLNSDKKIILISPTIPPKHYSVPDCNPNCISTSYNGRIFWYNGTFKEASESSTLQEFMRNEFFK